MKGKLVVECGILAVLGIVSAAAGFAAEATKVKVSEVRIEHASCVYPSSPAVGLGVIAGICAIFTRLLVSILVGCCCCRHESGSSFFNFLSWIASIVGVILLLGGATLNNRHGWEQEDHYHVMNVTSCYVLKSGIFAAGGVFSLLTAFFGIVAYVSASSAKRTTTTITTRVVNVML